MPPRLTHRRGFSLRDLLITLVLLVLVLVMVLPTLREIQQTKNTTACLVNLRENGLATLAYTQDNDGRFPPFGFGLSTDEQGLMRAEVVLRERSAAGLDQYQAENLVCPSDSDQGYLCVGSDEKSRERIAISYGYNINLIRTPLKLAELPTPATTTVLYDGMMSGACGSGESVGGLYQDGFAFAQHTSARRHDKQINLVYADWHTVTVDALSRRHVELVEPPTGLPD